MLRPAEPRSDGQNAGVQVYALDHVQLAMPPGGEGEATSFYEGLLGIARVAKPAALEARGGCWFEAGSVRVHLGVEAPFVPARKAHPAFVVRDLTAFVASASLDARWSDELPGVARCYVDDPFGNRLELVDAG